MSTPPLPMLRLNGTAYGFVLAIATLAATIIVAHHPVADVRDHAEGLTNILALADASQWVHGALMAIMILFMTGFSGFAWRLGISHPAVMAGWLCYLTGGMTLILAALIDGFLVADLARQFAARPETHPAAFDIIALCGVLIQGLSRLGFVLTGFALIMWAHALAHHKGVPRLIAALAMVTGGGTAAFMLGNPARLDPRALIILFAAQTVWNLTVAVWLVRGLKRLD